MEIGNGIRKLETGNGQQMFMLQLRVSLATTCIQEISGWLAVEICPVPHMRTIARNFLIFARRF